MAFEIDELSLMAYTGANGGHHLYWYSNTAEDDALGAGFFNPAADQMNVGDVIFDVDGLQFLAVTAIADGVVTVAAVIQPST